MKKKQPLVSEWQISVGLAFIIVGFLFSVQMKSKAIQNKKTEIPNRRIEEITNLLQESEKQREIMKDQLIILRKQIDKVNQISKSKKKNELREDKNISKAKMILTGFIPLNGKGIVINLDDSKKALESDENPSNLIIHNEDLLKIVNELYSSGAEVISINGNRLISSSEISCAGPTIIINKNRVAPPFKIKAIGDPDLMISALEMRGGVIEYLKFFGIEIEITESKEINIPAYNGNLDFKYSRPTIEPQKGKL